MFTTVTTILVLVMVLGPVASKLRWFPQFYCLLASVIAFILLLFALSLA